MTQEIEKSLRDYLSREFLEDRPEFELTTETNLLTEHIIDSLGIFVLIGYLEEHFGVSIDADDVVIEHFETITGISRLVETKLAGAAKSPSLK
jgi:acyl carrier protein